MFIAVLFTIAKTQKQPEYPSTDKWIKKLWRWGREVGLDRVGWRDGEKMQTTVIE